MQCPAQWVMGGLCMKLKLTTHLHLVPRSTMYGALPPQSVAQTQGQDHFTLFTWSADPRSVVIHSIHFHHTLTELTLLNTSDLLF
jgi:hypothetical protein